MRNPPPCLRRRYDAIDDLVRELDATLPAASDEQEDSPELRLLCCFWNILKDEQDSDVMAAVQSNLDAPRPTTAASFRQRMQCYMSDCSKRAKKESSKEMSDRIKSTCCSKPSPRASAASSSGGCCSPRSPRASAAASALSAYSADNKEPLAKALVNLKQAATVHKKCNEQVAELLSSEKQLLEQIVHLEHREKDGLRLLKEVECMWNCMEDGYKKKIAQSLEKQKAISVQLKDIEQSSSKWRKNMKDLEFQFNNLYKCEQEIKDKINQKESDIKCIDAEIVALNKRVETTKKETEYIKKCSGPKKKATDNIISNLNASMKKIESSIYEEKRLKETKKKEGEKYIKEARNDLTNIKKALEQKTAENDDLLATKEALLQEVDYLAKSNTEWTQKSRTRHKDVAAEIYKLEKEIAAFKLRCVQCHQCVDTADVRRFCNDCPRCAEKRECINSKDSTFCVADPKNDCVCLTVKRAFIDNVFDNMYNVLSRHAKGKAGKAVANIIMNCLQRSTNGKLDSAARHAIQTFILKTIKRNLNLTIIGGAVKTRCEMDQDTYSKLLLCLKKVQPTVVNKTDHGTDSRKAPCRRFGGTGECHCPKGPSFCICGRKAPEPIPDPTSCPPTKKAPIPSDAMACPRFSNSGLGPAGGGGPSTDQMLSWRPAPCQARTCSHPGPGRGASPPRGCDPARCSSALVPGVMPADSAPGMLLIKTGCACGNTPCTCPTNNRSRGRAARSCSTCTHIWSQTRSLVMPNPAAKHVSETKMSTVKLYFRAKTLISPDLIKDEFMKIRVNNKIDRPLLTGRELTSTSSGNILVDLKESSGKAIRGLVDKKCDIFVTVYKSSSLRNILDFASVRTNGSRRASVKTTTSGTTIVKVPPHILSQMSIKDWKSEDKMTNVQTPDALLDTTRIVDQAPGKLEKDTNHFHTLTVKNMGIELSSCKVLLKPTPSHNFRIVIDKDCEESHKDWISSVLDVETKSRKVKVKKADHRNCVIDLNDHGEHSNAILSQLSNGSIKLSFLDSDPNSSRVDRSTAEFLMKEIVGNMNRPCDIDYFNSKRSLVTDVFDNNRKSSGKAQSDSKIYDSDFKIKEKTPRPKLRCTSSGRYAIILNKDSKKAFIQDLQSYLSKKTNNQIPLERTTSGEVTINLDREKGQYGRLKISTSGNIFVVVDENTLNKLKNVASTSPAENSAQSSNFIIHTNFIESGYKHLNKAPATTCIASSGVCISSSCVCDPSGMCGILSCPGTSSQPTKGIEYTAERARMRQFTDYHSPSICSTIDETFSTDVLDIFMGTHVGW